MNGDGLTKSFPDSPPTHVQLVTANVTSESDWKKVVDLAKDKFGGVDILINNAGQSFATKCSSAKLMAQAPRTRTNLPST